MTVIISLISIFLLLLANYNFALPIEPIHDNSTTIYDSTNDTKAIHNDDEVYRQLFFGDAPAELSNNDDQKSFDNTDNNQFTTSDQFEYPEDVTLPLSTAKDDLLTLPSTITAIESTSNDTKIENTTDNHLLTTLQLNIQFKQTLDVPDIVQHESESPIMLQENFFTNDSRTDIKTNVESASNESKSFKTEILTLTDDEPHASELVLSVKINTEASPFVEYEAKLPLYVESASQVPETSIPLTESESEIFIIIDSTLTVSTTTESPLSISVDPLPLSVNTESKTSEESSDNIIDTSTSFNVENQPKETITVISYESLTESSEEMEVSTISDSTNFDQLDSNTKDESND